MPDAVTLVAVAAASVLAVDVHARVGGEELDVRHSFLKPGIRNVDERIYRW